MTIDIAKAVQKLKQKSQSNNFDISFGAFSIILSLIPNLSISRIKKAANKETNTIIYIVGIALVLLA